MSVFERMMENVVDGKAEKDNKDDFESVLRAHRFELLRQLKYRATKSNKDIAQGYLELDSSRKEEIATSIFKKGKQMKNLSRGIFLNGLLKFNDYESKLRFLTSPVYRFGMKFYDQQKNIHFSDADFANTLSIQSKKFDNRSLSDACKIINTVLLSSGFSSEDLCTIGNLKAMADVQLENVLVRPNTNVSVRFHNFYEAREAYHN